MSDAAPRIGLALSGGGVRAAVFHLGVLRRLARQGSLENVTTLSTVSGGSLVTAVIFSRAGLRWPTSADYLEVVYPALKTLLTTTDLFSFRAVGWSGLVRFNHKIVTHRARIIADLLERRWGVFGGLVELPDLPSWSINTTSLESGKNWRFSKLEMGDWQFGKHYNPPFRIAEAAAASAAVPYVLGALSLRLPKDGWFEEDLATKETRKRISPEKAAIRLWDGGAYENLARIIHSGLVSVA